MNKQDTPKQYKTTNKLKIFLTNKGVEIINLPKILQYKKIFSKMPFQISKDDITNKLQQSIRLKLFRYKKLTPLFKAKVF